MSDLTGKNGAVIFSGDLILAEYVAGEACPKPFGDYPAISRAIVEGATLHAFRSGGGLRVVRVEKGSEPGARRLLMGYGEHPYIEHAFDYCEDDLKAGGRDYSEVYGKLYPHFLTGSSAPSSAIDRWILMGRDFDIGIEGELFILKAQLRACAIPRDLYYRVAATRDPLTYEDARGFRYEIKPFTLAGGHQGSAANCTYVPEGQLRFDAFEYNKPFSVAGATLGELLVKTESVIEELTK